MLTEIAKSLQRCEVSRNFYTAKPVRWQPGPPSNFTVLSVEKPMGKNPPEPAFLVYWRRRSYAQRVDLFRIVCILQMFLFFALECTLQTILYSADHLFFIQTKALSFAFSFVDRTVFPRLCLMRLHHLLHMISSSWISPSLQL